jgi:glutathione S-transferase
MITVHHLEASRSQRVLWLLEELGLPYQLVTYPRDKWTRLAPSELRKIHPLGKSPVIADGDTVLAESAAILEYLAIAYGGRGGADVQDLLREPGSPQWLQVRYWVHFAEGSLMNWLVMKLVFTRIPSQPMPFFVRPVARRLCDEVLRKLIEPNVGGAVAFVERHLADRDWFAGDRLSVADFQMSFAVEAALARSHAADLPNLLRYRERMHARPAYQRALAKGGPVIMTA